jgi:ribonuclease VapC
VIAVDTSALVAIVAEEAASQACREALENGGKLYISGGTVAEAVIVAEGRELGRVMRHLIEALDFNVVPVTHAFAYQVGEAFRSFGKGRHPAKLNYGDCFAYALAKQLDCPLLFIGNDFSQTDIQSVL